ncbi:MAG: phage portal protein [Hyphomicrobiaceae bacterium]|nr:phage portal protein [Hyphomicrobiaceae bacterium]
MTQLSLPLISTKREKRSASPSSWDLLSGRAGLESDAGIPVSPHLAENLSAVFGAVQIIAETVATLPFCVYRREREGVRQVDPSHPVARLLGREPNELQTPVEFIEMMTAHCLLRGNAYAEIVRDARGAPIELIPLHPDMVSVLVIPNSRRVVYDVTDWANGSTRRLLKEEVLHIRDRSDDGIVGKSRLARARETFGTALATERFAASTYKNGASLSGVLSHPDEIGEEASKNLRESFERMHSGSDKAGKIAVLEEGMRWQSTSVSPEDAQMLESRKFGVEQVSRLFRVPVPLLADLSGGNYSSLVELSRWFAGGTIRPWLNRWERAIERALFSEQGRRTHEVEADMGELLRGDALQRFQSYRIGREIGVYSANELRALEHLNPRDDDDANSYLSPLNMASEQAGGPPQRDG